MKKRITSLFIIMVMLISLLPVLPVQATTTTIPTIKIGDYVQMGKYYDEPILWRCVDVDQNGPLMLSDRILTIKPFDAAGDHKYLDGTAQADNSYGRRTGFGSNLWQTSNMRSWLNSTASAGNVVWLDGCPPTKDKVYNGYNAYADEKGFLAEGNFTASEQSAIKSVTQKSLLNEVDVPKLKEDGTAPHSYRASISDVIQNYDVAFYQNVTDKMFLLDVKQLNKVYQNGIIFGTDYWIGKPTKKAVTNSEYKNSGLAVGLNWDNWNRSPFANSSGPSGVRDATPGGDVHVPSANNNILGMRPAFYINLPSVIFKSGNGSIETPYMANSESNSIKVMPQKLNVAKNKKWSIKLSLSVNPADINSNNIYVADKNGNVFPTTVYQDTTDNKVICVQPVNDYVATESYTIWIKELKSIDGKKVLKNNVKMDFTIGN